MKMLMITEIMKVVRRIRIEGIRNNDIDNSDNHGNKGDNDNDTRTRITKHDPLEIIMAIIMVMKKLKDKKQ